MAEHRRPDPEAEQAAEQAAERAAAATGSLLADLAARADRPMRSLRVRTASCSVEIEWAPPDRDRVPAAAAVGTEDPADARPGADADDQVMDDQVMDDQAMDDQAMDDREADHRYLRAPTVGVYYAAPSPGAEPFVRVGDLVAAGQQVAILEAMKVMIPVEADRAGRVAAVLARDGQAVEYGAPLLRIDPVPA